MGEGGNEATTGSDRPKVISGWRRTRATRLRSMLNQNKFQKIYSSFSVRNRVFFQMKRIKGDLFGLYDDTVQEFDGLINLLGVGGSHLALVEHGTVETEAGVGLVFEQGTAVANGPYVVEGLVPPVQLLGECQGAPLRVSPTRLADLAAGHATAACTMMRSEILGYDIHIAETPVGRRSGSRSVIGRGLQATYGHSGQLQVPEMRVYKATRTRTEEVPSIDITYHARASAPTSEKHRFRGGTIALVM